MTVHIACHIRTTSTTSDKGVDSVSTSTAQHAAPAAAADESYVAGIDHAPSSDRFIAVDTESVFA